jgi:PAS domain S-box-containing protein
MFKLKLPRLDGELDGELEKQYRLQFLPADIKQAASGILIFLIATILFIVSDYALLGLKPLLFYIMAFRLAFLIAGIFVLFSLRRTKNPAQFDLNILLFSLLGVALVTFINYTRPVDYIGHTYVDIVILLVIYLGIPSKLFVRYLTALLFTLSCIVLVGLVHNFVSTTNLLAILFSLVAVNIGGLLLSHLLYSFRRRHFVAGLKIAKDLRDLKEAEAKLKNRNALLDALINSSSEIIIYALDKDLNYLAFNRNHQTEMSKIWNVDIAPGMSFLDLITPANLREKTEKRLARALRGEAFTELEYLPDRNIWYEYNWNPIRQENGDIIGVTAFIRDFTQRKLGEAAALEAEALKRLDKAKSELLANVSHELRTPLASIKGFIETLLATDVKWTKKQQMDFLEAANQESDHLTLLIKNLLDMSRIDSGKLNLEMKPCAIEEILASACSRLRALAANHELRIDISPGLPPVIMDKMRIAQVITNLVENAAKFSPGGSPITISAALREGNLLVSVADLGIGIPAEGVQQLFNRFYQAENVVSGKTKGTGLGLSICKGIVEAHGGRMSVESAVGRGSVFSFSLPLTRPSVS